METKSNKLCSNCGATFQLKFCQNCGQKDKDFEPSLKDWVHAVWDDFLFVDAKLIITLKVLFQPGKYTRDWLQGRQVRYVHPVRLYIFLSVIYGLMNSFFDPAGEFLDGFIDALTTSEKDPTAQTYFKAQIIQVVSIVTLPISVISAQLFDRRSKMVTSVFFVINLYSAFLILLIGAKLLSLISFPINNDLSYALTTILLVLILYFVSVSAKRVYSIGNLSTGVRSISWVLANLFLFVAITTVSLGYYQAHREAELKEETQKTIPEIPRSLI